MKTFEKPFCEVVQFKGNIIADSNYCYCWDGAYDFGEGANDCGNDIGYCTCKINHTPQTANCT